MIQSLIHLLRLRLKVHLPVWLLLGVFVYLTSYLYVRPNEQSILFLNWLFNYGLVLLIYQTNSSYLFPRYLYPGRWLSFLLRFIALFALVYALMYVGYIVLQSVARLPESAITEAKSPRSNLLMWYRVYQSGPLGWLYNTQGVFEVLAGPYILAALFLTWQLIRHNVNLGSSVRQSEFDNLKLSQENVLLELDFLKSQLNPHFLFNSLNSIYVRVIDVDDEAADLVLRLAELMRYNLYETDTDTVQLDLELNYIENYLQLEQARHGQRVEIIFSREGAFERFRIAPLILLAFVENAFKHGIGGQQQEAYVWIEAHLEEEQTLIFTVQNSLATSTHHHFPDRKAGGAGLPNVRQRLVLLYPDTHQIDVEQTPDSYIVTLTLRVEPVPTEMSRQ